MKELCALICFNGKRQTEFFARETVACILIILHAVALDRDAFVLDLLRAHAQTLGEQARDRIAPGGATVLELCRDILDFLADLREYLVTVGRSRAVFEHRAVKILTFGLFDPYLKATLFTLGIKSDGFFRRLAQHKQLCILKAVAEDGFKALAVALRFQASVGVLVHKVDKRVADYFEYDIILE